MSTKLYNREKYTNTKAQSLIKCVHVIQYMTSSVRAHCFVSYEFVVFNIFRNKNTSSISRQLSIIIRSIKLLINRRNASCIYPVFTIFNHRRLSQELHIKLIITRRITFKGTNAEAAYMQLFKIGKNCYTRKRYIIYTCKHTSGIIIVHFQH